MKDVSYSEHSGFILLQTPMCRVHASHFAAINHQPVSVYTVRTQYVPLGKTKIN